MSTSVAIVDNLDSLLHYAGGWVKGGIPSEFNDTTIWTGSQGATISFNFVGSSIAVYATVAAVNPPNASMSFAVDNSITGTYTPEGVTTGTPHSLLWQSPAMDDASHTLIITQTAAQSGGVIFVDYLLYNTTSTAVRSYLVDDSDTRVTYTGNWEEVWTDDNMQHTSHGSTNAGDSLSLKFEGSSIFVYGDTVPGGPNTASFSIDGGPPIVIPYTPPATRTPNTMLFNSGDLASGEHTLVVTAGNAEPVFIDYFLITPNGPLFSSSSSSAGAATSTATSSIAPGPSNLSDSVQGKKSPPIAAIVGSVIGTLIIVAVVLISLLVCRHRRRARQDQHANMPTPYIYSDSSLSSGTRQAQAHVWRPNSENPPSELPHRSKGMWEVRRWDDGIARSPTIRTVLFAAGSGSNTQVENSEPPKYVA
ncbi:hypothetical protein C8R46DRAFT_1060229 [Mycena filopes]|nr:hypothetical protein C8R46DRAFT_1060229 [Mycena filopes]